MLPLPSAVLFACTMNAVRSPMAEALMKHLWGQRVFVDSVGVRGGGTVDGFVIAVMDEIGLDLRRHTCKTFDDLDDGSFDLVISLSPDAQHRAVELTRTNACAVEFWPTFDPAIADGHRERKLAAYRDVRDALEARILTRFPQA